MSLYQKIVRAVWPIHRETDKRPYLVRYKTTELTLRDHYRHLIQLVPIYEAMEKSLKKSKYYDSIPKELKDLFSRAEKVKKDLAFLKPFIASKEGLDKVMASTQKYVAELNAVDSDECLFAHYLVRILGDLHGGQRLRENIKGHYTRNKIVFDEELGEGIEFYRFSDDAKADFKAWLDEISYQDEDKLCKTAITAFEAHIQIFDELEKSRTTTKSQFFTVRNAILMTATAAASVAAYTLIC